MQPSQTPYKFKKRRDHQATLVLPTKLSQAQIKKLADKYLFNEQEVVMIKNRFNKFADQGVLRPKQFKDSLGIMGLEPFLSDRIFSLIDKNNNQQISFEDFVRYISILLNGSAVEKALWSFKLLTNNKNILEIEDFENMIFQMCYLWNSMTGSKSIPQREFVQEIFAVYDVDNDGIVSFEDFNQVYSDGIELIGWFEFLNNEDINLKKVKEEWDVRKKNHKKRAAVMQRGFTLTEEMSKIQEQTVIRQEIRQQFQVIQWELQRCMDMIHQERDYQANKHNNKNMMLIFDTNSSKSKIGGPQLAYNQAPSMWGDDGPIGPEDESSVVDEFANEFSDDSNDQFQVRMMTKMRRIIQLSEEMKRINKLDSSCEPVSPKQRSKLQRMNRSKSRGDEFVERDASPLSKPLGYIQDEGVRKNLSIYFGHENWNLVLNMMIGIRKAIKSLHPLNDDIQVSESAFQMKYQFEIVIKRTAEFDCTKSSIFYEYAPLIFERIRKLYGVQNEDYQRSVGPEQLVGDLLFGNLSSLSEKVSSGKSGSFFYYSFDDKYMLKTISRDEFLFFKQMIKQYYEHLLVNYNSLIIKLRQHHHMNRVFGLYKMKMMKSKTKQEKIYFVVMVNIFCTEFQIRERYDLKGSMHGRTSRKRKNPFPDISVPLKDLDWIQDKRVIKLNQQTSSILKQEIEKDVAFFDSLKIIDYSFLIGYAPITPQQAAMQSSTPSQARFYEVQNTYTNRETLVV